MISFHPSRRQTIATASVLSFAMVAVAGTSVAAGHHDVMVEVDGVTRPVTGFQKTVGDVLDSAGVAVSGHDLVAPGLDRPVSDGLTVVVRTAKEYTLTVDGRQVKAWSTGTSIEDVLEDAAGGSVVMAADRSEARASLPALASGGVVKVLVDGKSLPVSASAGDDVATLLGRSGVTLSPIDRVAWTRTGGSVVLQVTRVTRGERTETTSVAFPTQEREDADLEKGTTSVVQEGRKGSTATTYYEETVGGKKTVSVKVSTKKTAPVAKIVAVGTKAPVQETATASAASSGSSSSTTTSAATPSAAGGGVWAALAQCESGGNPSTNTGNGFYGMYQFTLGTWQALGGSGLPSDASAAEQTARAQALQAQSGWGQWPGCAAQLGLL